MERDALRRKVGIQGTKISTLLGDNEIIIHRENGAIQARSWIIQEAIYRRYLRKET